MPHPDDGVLIIFMPRRTPIVQTTAFGQWLRGIREERGFVMEELAARAEISQATISNLERGRRNPTRKMVTRLARELAPDSAGDPSKNRILNQGLLAAGFAPTAPEGPDEIERITEPERHFVARYRRLPLERQTLINRLVDELGADDGHDD
jgi:transcriptional regulator with XRE-family HTH domain